ncbi:uncharacterized protein LOC104585044 [Brachypodium distachyon]|uniref:GATA-type domain-containing protein n=1 Tax=Brachypodium distachyon TaxID=15368 RepID=I1IMV8_BRADI|nr:uncharacterized protein LOC104585044 [Brachypodium distachyon]KQJ89112.1 hypothetical protein BRADI_4g23550v3 [Brachypodium distachyon]|eukprot:XP_010239253.1 uncharacterized protein LOC104585044 [Brachypodium distachyon]
MRKPGQYVYLHEDPLALDVVDGLDLSPPGGGLCSPDDPLDKVMTYVALLDDGFLEDLGIDCSTLLDEESSRSALEEGGGGALPVAAAAASPGGTKRSAREVFDGVPGAPSSIPVSTTSAGPFLGTLEAPDFGEDLSWTVLPKPHHRRTAARRRQVWPVSFPLALTTSPGPAAAAHDDSNANDDVKDKDFKLISRCNVGKCNGNKRRRLSEPKKRQRDKDNVEDKDFELVGYCNDVGVGNGKQRRSAEPKQQLDKDGRLRTCTHCCSWQTPQWRHGPNGNGTLCNACGIRYKMGKLCEEYRPSTSPEFSSLKHSNRHRNVEKIRDQKMKQLKVTSPVPVVPVTPDSSEVLLRMCKYET